MNLGNGADEVVYRSQAQTLKDHGIRRGFRLLAERYLRDPGAEAYPSPLRWLWTLITAACGTKWPARSTWLLAPLALAWAVAPLGLPWWTAALACTSPLLWIVSSRELQDGPVAVLTLLAVGCALRGETAWLTLVAFALLSIKEVSPLTWPALAVAWGLSETLLALLVSLTVAALNWATYLAVIYGRSALPMLRRALTGHGTKYTRQHQSGAPHRLLVDLTLLSPLCLAALVAGWSRATVALAIAVALIAPHACAPVRNVRNVLAAELLLRAAAALAMLVSTSVAMTGAGLVLLAIYDVFVIFRTRDVYDPVTSELTASLGMSPRD